MLPYTRFDYSSVWMAASIIVISNTLTACGQVNRRIFVKNIVICADGTWNRPEKKLTKDFPTNVLKIARAIKPTAKGDVTQQVFYDWGIGSYYDPILGGATGKGINKNIMDDSYRRRSVWLCTRRGPIPIDFRRLEAASIRRPRWLGAYRLTGQRISHGSV